MSMFRSLRHSELLISQIPNQTSQISEYNQKQAKFMMVAQIQQTSKNQKQLPIQYHFGLDSHSQGTGLDHTKSKFPSQMTVL